MKKENFKMRCGYCPRVIFKSDEPDGEFKKVDGKVICPVCRILKTSKHKDEIKADKKKYDKEKKKKEKKELKEEFKRISEVAVASQERAGKKYKLKKNKK